jgi:hypothetical protein
VEVAGFVSELEELRRLESAVVACLSACWRYSSEVLRIWEKEVVI